MVASRATTEDYVTSAQMGTRYVATQQKDTGNVFSHGTLRQLRSRVALVEMALITPRAMDSIIVLGAQCVPARREGATTLVR